VRGVRYVVFGVVYCDGGFAALRCWVLSIERHAVDLGYCVAVDGEMLTGQKQSVRRKGGKTGRGHVYIICSLNPKHKQRQGK